MWDSSCHRTGQTFSECIHFWVILDNCWLLHESWTAISIIHINKWIYQCSLLNFTRVSNIDTFSSALLCRRIPWKRLFMSCLYWHSRGSNHSSLHTGCPHHRGWVSSMCLCFQLYILHYRAHFGMHERFSNAKNGGVRVCLCTNICWP